MKPRLVLFAVAIVAMPLMASAQVRWDKVQQKLDELRPKGKLLQQIKESIEGGTSSPQSPAKSVQSTVQTPAKNASLQTQVAPNSNQRQIPAQNAARQSILNTSRNLPSDGVVLGIQIDPKFLPAQKLVITEVDRRSPAGKAGLRAGDQIVAIGGTPTPTLKSLDGVLASLNPGDQTMIEFVRNRKAEKTLVRFNGPANPSAQVTISDQLASQDADLKIPAPPDLSEIPAVSPASQSTAGLRSVLSAPSGANRIAPDNQAGPTFFPSSELNPAIVGSAQRDVEFGNARGVSIEQLQERIRQQQQLIEQLTQQLQQFQNGNSVPAEILPGETIILDADGN